MPLDVPNADPLSAWRACSTATDEMEWPCAGGDSPVELGHVLGRIALYGWPLPIRFAGMRPTGFLPAQPGRRSRGNWAPRTRWVAERLTTWFDLPRPDV